MIIITVCYWGFANKKWSNFSMSEIPKKIYQIIANLRAIRVKSMSDKMHYVNFLEKMMENTIKTKCYKLS